MAYVLNEIDVLKERITKLETLFERMEFVESQVSNRVVEEETYNLPFHLIKTFKVLDGNRYFTVQEISKKLNLHRVTVFNQLNSLIARHLVGSFLKKNRRYYFRLDHNIKEEKK